jgi:hypothetical protein
MGRFLKVLAVSLALVGAVGLPASGAKRPPGIKTHVLSENTFAARPPGADHISRLFGDIETEDPCYHGRDVLIEHKPLGGGTWTEYGTTTTDLYGHYEVQATGPLSDTKYRITVAKLKLEDVVCKKGKLTTRFI